MKISGIHQKQIYQTGQVKKEKETAEPDRVILGGSSEEVPDFIKHGKILSQAAREKERKMSKFAGPLVGAAMGGGMATLLTIPLRLNGGGMAANLIIAGSAVAGGAMGALLDHLDKGNTSDKDTSIQSMETSIRSMQTTVAICTNTPGMI